MEARIFIFEPTAYEQAWMKQNKEHPLAKLRRELDKFYKEYLELCESGDDDKALEIEAHCEKLCGIYERAWRG